MSPRRAAEPAGIALHDLGGFGPTLLICHATGFHGRCYLPLATALGTEFSSWAPDARGHGSTPADPDRPVAWEDFADDIVDIAADLAPAGGLFIVGPSMGGACALMAAHRAPELFEAIVAFEPIVFPPSNATDSGLADGARRRRARFDSVEAAIQNYASKPPMNAFAPEALRCYVEFGTAVDGDGVRLSCTPEFEARTFEAGTRHHTWDLLPEIPTRTLIV
jgi:pimeloyl-ACP methyl ester carboxylesterase